MPSRIPSTSSRKVSYPSALSNLTLNDKVLFYRYGLGPARHVQYPIIHHSFEEHARNQPDAIAVEHSLFNHSLTYSELDVQANRLARRLRAVGIVPGKRVCILARRSTYLIVAILATLKSGAQYVPLDAVTITESTLDYVLKDSNPSAVLVMDEFAHRVQSEVPVLHLEETILADEMLTADATKPEDTTSASDGAYVIYTSGTTGVPKGVDVKHGGVTNGMIFPHSQHDAFLICSLHTVISGSPGNVGMCPGMRVGQLLNIAFDMGAWEILGSLYNGCTLCLRGNTKKEWIALMKTIDIVIATPSILACHEPDVYPNIKHVIVGGEVCTQGAIRLSLPFYRNSDIDCFQLWRINGLDTPISTIAVVLQRFLSAIPYNHIPQGILSPSASRFLIQTSTFSRGILLARALCPLASQGVCGWVGLG